jgi:hypothetical protein
MTQCTWCKNPNAEEIDDTLCRMHQAEAEGLSESELDRRDDTQHAEYMDTLG